MNCLPLFACGGCSIKIGEDGVIRFTRMATVGEWSAQTPFTELSWSFCLPLGDKNPRAVLGDSVVLSYCFSSNAASKLLTLARTLHWFVRLLEIGACFSSGRHLLRPSLLQDLFCPFRPFRIVAMDRKQNAAFFDTPLISLGFVLRYTHSHQCSGDATDRPSDSYSCKRRHNRASRDERAYAWDCECADADKPS